MYELRITGGPVYTGGGWKETDIYIKDGRIARIGGGALPARRVYDAAGGRVIPGLIDAHVHLGISCDDMLSGGEAAIAGGTTTVIDFLGEARDVDAMRAFLNKRMADGSRCPVDYSFHVSARQPNDPEALIDAGIAEGLPTVKVYTTYAFATDEEHIAALLRRTAAGDSMVLCHIEENSRLRSDLADMADYGRRRPPECETEGAERLARLTEETGGLFYMVHVSCGSSIERVKAACPGLAGDRFFFEGCPHYFLFNDAVYSSPGAHRFTMTPPIRPEAERALLCGHIDDIAVISTDHCPFPEERKLAAIDAIPMGAGGLGFSFAQMYRLFGDRVIDKFTANQARLHGLEGVKGVIAEGADADIAVFDPIPGTPVAGTLGRCDFTIYEGLPETVRFRDVFSRGDRVLAGGRLAAEPGRGRFLRRTIRR